MGTGDAARGRRSEVVDVKSMCGWRLSRGGRGVPWRAEVAAGGRPLAVAAEVGREGGEGGAVREAARVVFESVGEGAGLGRPGAVDELEAGDQVPTRLD